MVIKRNCSARVRESLSNGSNSSSSAADSKSRVDRTMITEENKNGFRLRVRFAPKEMMPKFADKALSNEALHSHEGDNTLPKHSCLKHPAAQNYK